MIMLATPEERWIQQVELQQLTELSETKLVSPLEELVRRGLIIREQDPADRRRNRVRLTSDGLRLADAARDRHARVEEMLFGRLSLDERRLLAELLERVAVNVRLNQNDFEKFDQRIVG